MARQKLGQHFLKDSAKIKKIIEALEIKDGDVVIEIGAGHGELTENLKSPACAKASAGKQISNLKIIAIEKDPVLVKKLISLKVDMFENNLEIIEGDALKMLPNLISNYKLQATSYKLIGNIPYYITGRLLREIGGLETKPTIVVLTIQKEVALRVCARPTRTSPARDKSSQSDRGHFQRPAGGCIPDKASSVVSNGMNLLAASVQYWAEPEIVDFIPKKSFSPPPEVDSAIIKLNVIKPNNITLSSRSWDKCYKNYCKFIKILFKQPRKTIKNNILPLLKNNKELAAEIEGALAKHGLKLSDRPQNMSVEIIKKLSQMLYNEAE